MTTAESTPRSVNAGSWRREEEDAVKEVEDLNWLPPTKIRTNIR
jgi:hypothetical protein